MSSIFTLSRIETGLLSNPFAHRNRVMDVPELVTLTKEHLHVS